MNEPTILCLAPHRPYPPVGGARTDIFGRYQPFTAAGFRIVLAVCPTPAMAERMAGSAAPDVPLVSEARIIPRRSRWAGPEEPGTVRAVQELVDRHRPAVVWCDYADLYPLASALDRRGAPLWVRSVNFELAHALEKELEHRRWRDWTWRGAPRAGWRWLRSLHSRLRPIRRIERSMQRGADRVFYISPADRRWMARLYGSPRRGDWVPPFLEAAPVTHRESPTLDVLYAGSEFSNNLNQAGGRYILERLAPAAEARFPGAFRFHIVGRRAVEMLGEGGSNVRVHGWVEDLDGLTGSMDIACVPVRWGWGCKIKVVEALCAGLPTIGASQAFRGVPPESGAFIACRGLSDYLDGLSALRTVEARRAMGEAGRAAYARWREQGRTILQDALEDARAALPTRSMANQSGEGGSA